MGRKMILFSKMSKFFFAVQDDTASGPSSCNVEKKCDVKKYTEEVAGSSLRHILCASSQDARDRKVEDGIAAIAQKE